MCTICSDTSIDIEKPFKISAGPGAGKTRFLINHIRNVLSNSKRLNTVNNIACITYTNIAVEEIKTRLKDKSGSVDVSTIHSFLYRNLVKPYAYLAKDNENNPISINMKELDGHDEHQPSTRYVMEWINNIAPRYKFLYKEENRPQLKQILSGLRYIFTNQELLQEIAPNQIPTARAIQFPTTIIKSKEFFVYKKMYWQEGIIDHEDVLYVSYQLLKQNPVLVDILRCKYPYIFIDEFQDTNPIQTEIVKMLASEKCVIGVIGDYNQSIYGFQGAKPEDFSDFSIENLIEYKISDNWRSTEKIINTLDNFTGIQQKCKRNMVGDIPSIIVGNLQNTLPFIKQKEAELLDNHFTSIILTKNNKDLLNIKTNLNSQQYQLFDNIWDEFQTKDTKERYILITQVLKSYQYAKDKRFELALNEILKLFKKQPFNIIKDKLKQRTISLEVLELCTNLDSINEKTIKEFYYLLKEKFKVYGIELSSYGKGQAATFAEEHSVEDMSKHLKITEYKTDVSTIHGAKGTEYDMVSLFIFDDGTQKAENKLKDFITNPNLQNEKHRRKYVALSRAKDHLFIVVTELSEQSEQLINKKGLYNIIRV